jgi:hypothetical protein
MIGVVNSQLDVNALDYLNRAGNSGTLARLAVSHLAWELKRNNLWTKMKAFYPMMGTTGTMMGANLISSSYAATFSGGWTFSSTGALPDGLSAYALTGLIPSSVLTLNSTTLGFYCRTATPEALLTGVQIGCGSGSDRSAIQILKAGTFTVSTRINTSGAILSGTITSSQGLFTVTRTSSTLTTAYRNATSLGTDSATSTNLPTAQVCIGATNIGGVISTYSSKELACAFIADGLTGAEVSTLYTIIQQYQTILSRNV